MTPPLRGLIFDLDGTLCDTLPVCIAAFQDVFARYALRPYSADEIRALFGPDEAGIIQRVIGDDWEAGLAHYLDAYASAHDACPAPFKGLLPLLHDLQARDVPLALVTGKGAGSCAISLERLGLATFFSVVKTGSAAGAVKPQRIRAVLAHWGIPPEQVAYVGDAPTDVLDARACGVVALAAAWATSSDPTALAATQPAALFPTVADFARWVDRYVI
ncbi:MAG: hypothetical protein DCC58_10310 [Chloroflexi bacterium]|nr:MAG: hypothetical protein DCC58_10310 [Chloroflexota bacterium]